LSINNRSRSATLRVAEKIWNGDWMTWLEQEKLNF
jgi:hypothetical protein